MVVKVHLRHLHISPRKVRLVATLVRGMEVEKAKNQLAIVSKKSALPISKLIDSAIATAVHDFELDKNNLFISKIIVNEAPVMKRWMPRAHGRAYPILKRASHITLELDEKVKSERKLKSKKKSSKDDIVKIEDLKKEMEKAKKADQAKDKKILSEAKGPKNDGHGKAKRSDVKGSLNKIFRRKSG